MNEDGKNKDDINKEYGNQKHADMQTYQQLYDLALLKTEFAYAPYSRFKVGAALLCQDGTVYYGVNVENSSYGAGICAERTAIAKAVSEGKRAFKALAVTAVSEDGPVEASPCGICRQFLFEFGDDIDVIFGPDRDHLKSYPISQLLEYGFRLQDARKND